MLLFPTTTIIDSIETRLTVDLDKVSFYIEGPKGTTGLLFDCGENIVIMYDYDDLMKFIIENGDDDA